MGTCRPRPREMPLDLPGHEVGLLAQHGAVRCRDRARLAADHGQRVLERVREVAGLSPGALEERCVVIEQRVELMDERLHLARKALGQARGRARANVSESQPHALQWQQAIVHLRHHGADQTQRQHGERDRELGAELAHVLMDVDGRPGDRIDEAAGRSGNVIGVTTARSRSPAGPVSSWIRSSALAGPGRRRSGHSDCERSTMASPCSICQYQPDCGRLKRGSNGSS